MTTNNRARIARKRLRTTAARPPSFPTWRNAGRTWTGVLTRRHSCGECAAPRHPGTGTWLVRAARPCHWRQWRHRR
jgi:hypothetical protein